MTTNHFMQINRKTVLTHRSSHERRLNENDDQPEAAEHERIESEIYNKN